jgi:hypothetical protein
MAARVMDNHKGTPPPAAEGREIDTQRSNGLPAGGVPDLLRQPRTAQAPGISLTVVRSGASRATGFGSLRHGITRSLILFFAFHPSPEDHSASVTPLVGYASISNRAHGKPGT